MITALLTGLTLMIIILSGSQPSVSATALIKELLIAPLNVLASIPWNVWLISTKITCGTVGLNVGASVGLLVGWNVGVFVGVKVGWTVGLGFVGIGVGTPANGTGVGLKDGLIVGIVVGAAVGNLVGISVGRKVGDLVGNRVGIVVGDAVGSTSWIIIKE